MFVLRSRTNVLTVTKTHDIETIWGQRFSNDKSSTSRVFKILTGWNMETWSSKNLWKHRPQDPTIQCFPPFADQHSLSTSTSNDPFTSKRLFSNIPWQTKWKCQGLKRRMFPEEGTLEISKIKNDCKNIGFISTWQFWGSPMYKKSTSWHSGVGEHHGFILVIPIARGGTRILSYESPNTNSRAGP